MLSRWIVLIFRHDYTIGTLDMLQACDACADMGMTYLVIVQCTDCVVFPIFPLLLHLNGLYSRLIYRCLYYVTRLMYILGYYQHHQ